MLNFCHFEIFLSFWVNKQKSISCNGTELLYLLLVAKKKRCKNFLINARISDKSYNSYKILFFYKNI